MLKEERSRINADNATGGSRNWEPDVVEITVNVKDETIQMRALGRGYRRNWNAHVIMPDKQIPWLSRHNGELGRFLRAVRDELAEAIGKPVNPITTTLFMGRRTW